MGHTRGVREQQRERQGWPRPRRVLMAGAALAVASSPFAFGSRAEAVNHLDQKVATATFVTTGNKPVTCRLSVTGRHNTDTHTATGLQTSSDTAGHIVPECVGYHAVLVRYRDSHGASQYARSENFHASQETVMASGAFSPISVEHTIVFDNCLSGTCTLSVTTTPK